jgi:hypothetical protein
VASALRKNGAGLPGTATDVSLTLAGDTTWEEWVAGLRLLGRMDRAIQWWIGDMVNWGEERFGERFAQGVEALGLAPHTVVNYAWVARAVPVSRRRELLTFEHHAVVAPLAPEEQVAWLTTAEQRHLSTRELRAHLRSGSPEFRRHCPSCTCRPPDEAF